MPIIEAHILKGYDEGTRTRLSHGLTDALRLVIPAPHESITVIVHEMERDNYMRGGAARRHGEALSDPREVARRFHAAVMSGEFEQADQLVTDDCVIRLPHGVTVSRPHELASASSNYWTEMTMDIHGGDICAGAEGPVLYERSIINGVAVDGSKVEDLRSIIRIEFRGNLIREFEPMANYPLFPTKEA